ncbi:beta-galactosidase family protein [Lysinimonas soli]|uniref:Beta-galactosidase family protein n=1 Tax=Lysinimonas soli TaxID=1074233 RepID=A0ABW0NRR3_9MICO
MPFAPSTFAIGDTDFLLDGQPFRVLSGAIHYFRVHPEQWADRIHKARLMGLNTIETYVPWNAHAPKEGSWDATGRLDLVRFLQLVAEEGMRAIVRPGPYICAEWDGGGLPAWLFRDGPMRIRSSDPRFLAAVEGYFGHVLPMIEPLQVQHGGPVILVQVENEYGAYGADADYLDAITALLREGGIQVPLTTVDQPTDEMLANGSRPGLHLTASFGSRSAERLQTLRRHQPTGPLMCSEYWNGWFDNWGAAHHRTSAGDAAQDLRVLLAHGASVNFYMFHGGTNFGLSNGANDKGIYEPIVTSYDYDAPLDEAGAPTEKFWAFREVIAEFAEVPDELPAAAAPAPVFETRFESVRPLRDALPAIGELSDGLPSHDERDILSGFSLYRTPISVDGDAVLEFAEVRDRALVSIDGDPVGVLSRELGERAITLPSNAQGVLELLVEDQGRVDYGPRIGEPKGLIGPALVGGEPLGHWELLGLDLEALRAMASGGATPTSAMIAGPVLARAGFRLDEPADLFLDTAGWGKGVVWVNGFCLGRYWSRGPQRTLFVPSPVLRAGENEVTVFELHALANRLAFCAAPELGHVDS